MVVIKTIVTMICERAPRRSVRKRLLGGTKRLYEPLSRSVGPSVRRSVGPSSVSFSAYEERLVSRMYGFVSLVMTWSAITSSRLTDANVTNVTFPSLFGTSAISFNFPSFPAHSALRFPHLRFHAKHRRRHRTGAGAAPAPTPVCCVKS